MTVKELIAHLQAMPPDAVVIFDQFSEARGLDAEDVTLHRAEDKEYVLWNGYYLRFVSPYWDHSRGEPTFVTVCHFPGN